MKNLASKKILLITLGMATVFTSCRKEVIDETITVVPPQTESPKIIGDWESYKWEKQDLVLEDIDIVSGQLIHSMQWTAQPMNDNQLIFSDDHTFDELYAGVNSREGNWEVVSNNPYEFTFTFSSTPWSNLQTVYSAKMHCDNTMSIKYRVAPPAGNHEFQNAEWYHVVYYRKNGTTQCDDLVDYYVD